MRATDGVVHIWRADLAAAEDELGELLCAEERERSLRILDAHKRRLWMRSRGVLRALLARYVDRDPRALRFTLGPHGKPALRSGSGSGAGPRSDGGADLRFNVSHSGAIALYAVTAGRAVGIDVELPRSRQIDEPAIAERVLGGERARRLADLDPPARARQFLRGWVVHEAAVKCRGTGLGMPLAAADAGGDPWTAEWDVEPWTAELDVDPPAVAAVAVAGGRCELRYFEWPGYRPMVPVSAC